jgi:hypothetical protein
MNKICIHSLVFLAGALGCAALADEAIDSPSKELLASYAYQPEILVLPSSAFPTGENPAVFQPTVATDFTTIKPAHYNWRDLEEGMAQDKERQSHVLFAWDWHANSQWQLVGRPAVESLTIPWSPMTQEMNATLSPAAIDSASSKLQVRFPLVTLAF